MSADEVCGRCGLAEACMCGDPVGYQDDWRIYGSAPIGEEP